MNRNQLYSGASKPWFRIWSDVHFCLFTRIWESPRISGDASSPSQTCDHFCFPRDGINIQECERCELSRDGLGLARAHWWSAWAGGARHLISVAICHVCHPGRGQCLHSYRASSHSQHRYGTQLRQQHRQQQVRRDGMSDVGPWHRMWRVMTSCHTSQPWSWWWWCHAASHASPDITPGQWPCVGTGVIHSRQRDSLIIKTDGPPSHLPHVIILVVSVRPRHYCANIREEWPQHDARWRALRWWEYIVCGKWREEGWWQLADFFDRWSPENVIMWSHWSPDPGPPPWSPSQGDYPLPARLLAPGPHYNALFAHTDNFKQNCTLFLWLGASVEATLAKENSAQGCPDNLIYGNHATLTVGMEVLRYCLSRREGQIGSISESECGPGHCIYWTLFSVEHIQHNITCNNNGRKRYNRFVYFNNVSFLSVSDTI